MSFFEFPHTRNYDDDLGFIICEYKRLLSEYAGLHSTEKELLKQIEDMQNTLDDYVNGKFIDQYLISIEKWIIDNIGEILPTVFFGITDSGYFVAYVPEKWDDVKFATTGYDINIDGVDYGHLVLK